MADRPKIDFDPNVPVTLTVKFDSPGKSGEHNGHAWHLWTFALNGQDHALFADDALNNLLCEGALPIRRDDEITITRIKQGRDAAHWQVEHQGRRFSSQDGQGFSEPDQQQGTPQTPPQPLAKINGQPRHTQPAAPAPPKPTLKGMARVMAACIEESWALWEELAARTRIAFHAEDVRATADTLFIQASRAGIIAEPTQQCQQHPAALAREKILARQNRQGVQDDSQPPWAGNEPPMPHDSEGLF